MVTNEELEEQRSRLLESMNAVLSEDRPALMSNLWKPYDPYKGLPRKKVKGTHPYRAKAYGWIRRLLTWLSDKVGDFAGWLEYHADVTFWRKQEWEDHTVVDWDQVSPEERKRRTTITFGMGGNNGHSES